MKENISKIISKTNKKTNKKKPTPESLLEAYVDKNAYFSAMLYGCAIWSCCKETEHCSLQKTTRKPFGFWKVQHWEYSCQMCGLLHKRTSWLFPSFVASLRTSLRRDEMQNVLWKLKGLAFYSDNVFVKRSFGFWPWPWVVTIYWSTAALLDTLLTCCWGKGTQHMLSIQMDQGGCGQITSEPWQPHGVDM